MEAKLVSIANIGQGAAAELFEHALNKVMANIKDPNADPKKKRKITLTVEFSPFGDRSGADASISVTEKLVPVNSVRSSVFVAMQEGEYKAFSHDVRQEHIAFPDQQEDSKPDPKVTAMPAIPKTARPS